ncbi:hypothetical protein LWE61_00990 [Sphingobium sufflavum]|uniref:hypothetical protein n=1 Tax=Sphingobium sufflavum TaxID=1129547 RepID=UPI001F3AC284|nr:hypothetical protein [Sphingobium sufflavum]MCE7795123.1 hypothetical protein [Sphingobium sufflavum]
MIQGRPIRFLMSVVGGWTAIRLVMVLPLPTNILLPQTQFANRTARPTPPSLDWMFPQSPNFGTLRLASVRPAQAYSARPLLVGRHAQPVAFALIVPTVERGGSEGWSSATADSLLSAQMSFANAARPPLALADYTPGGGLSPGEAGAPLQRRFERAEERWAGTAWMLWRDEGDSRQVRLGGAQVGMRVDYGIAPASPLRPTLYGRASGALHGRAAAEVAVGVAIRPPLPFPAIVAVERRQAISPGGRDDFSVLAAAGIPPLEITHGFRLDGYGQGGIVGMDRPDGFVDGRLTLEKPVGRPRVLALGAAVWGGAQPGASRIDIGPQASVRLQIGGTRMRLGAEWREKLAGNAAPSSGAALTLGADF